MTMMMMMMSILVTVALQACQYESMLPLVINHCRSFGLPDNQTSVSKFMQYMHSIRGLPANVDSPPHYIFENLPFNSPLIRDTMAPGQAHVIYPLQWQCRRD